MAKTETAATTPPEPDVQKRTALTTILQALDPLSPTQRREVLRAAACYHGVTMDQEPIR